MADLIVRRLPARPGADPAAWAAVRELCCRTGDNGAPIPRDRWDFFPRMWIEPYEKILPQWTYLAEIEAEVVGYLTGCPDTNSFARSRIWRVDLPLLLEMTTSRSRHTPEAWSYIRRSLGIDAGVEKSFSPQCQKAIARDYPAHLHINVDAGHRRSGVGRRLVESYFADLVRARVRGIHLICGGDPLAFYRRLGFEILESVNFRGVAVFALGRQIYSSLRPYAAPLDG